MTEILFRNLKLELIKSKERYKHLSKQYKGLDKVYKELLQQFKKKVEPTKEQPEALKEECLECGGTLFKKIAGISYPCDVCFHTGKATIEIEKEWVECQDCVHWEPYFRNTSFCQLCSNKGKIQKYKVGYAYEIHLVCGTIVEYFPQLGIKCLNCNRWIKRIKEQLLEIEIISETETTQKLIMVEVK